MKNIAPQSTARQNNRRNTTPAAIASQAGVDNGAPLCHAGLGCCGFSCRYRPGTTKNANPDRCCDRGFSLFCRVALTYQEPPLRSGDDANNPFLEPRVSSNCQASAALRR